MWSYNYTNSDILEHYGILGMKWGVRRFQDKKGRLTSAGKKRYDSDSSNGKPGTSDDGEKIGWFEKKTGIHLSGRQKTAIKVGAILAGTALAIYGGYRLYNSDVGKPARDFVENLLDDFTEGRAKLRNTGELSNRQKKDLATRDVDSKLGLLKKKDLGSVDDDLKAINDGLFSNPLGKDPLGSSNNCTYCTTAYELRRRGYDVKANYVRQGRSVKSASEFFKDAKIESDFLEAFSQGTYRPISKSEYIQKISDKLAKYGDGARGNFCGQYPAALGGGGHSIIWEVVNGKTVFRDGQSGRTYASAQEALQYFKPGSSKFWRTDNLEINTDTIKQAVSNFGLPRAPTRIMETDTELAKQIRRQILSTRRSYGVDLKTAQDIVYKAYNIKI